MLNDLFGRSAASVDGFHYSAAMRNSGIVWSEESLRRYLPNPRALVPFTRMAYPGLREPQRVEDLIAYLKRFSKS